MVENRNFYIFEEVIEVDKVDEVNISDAAGNKAGLRCNTLR